MVALKHLLMASLATIAIASPAADPWDKLNDATGGVAPQGLASSHPSGQNDPRKKQGSDGGNGFAHHARDDSTPGKFRGYMTGKGKDHAPGHKNDARDHESHDHPGAGEGRGKGPGRQPHHARGPASDYPGEDSVSGAGAGGSGISGSGGASTGAGAGGSGAGKSSGAGGNKANSGMSAGGAEAGGAGKSSSAGGNNVNGMPSGGSANSGKSGPPSGGASGGADHHGPPSGEGGQGHPHGHHENHARHEGAHTGRYHGVKKGTKTHDRREAVTFHHEDDYDEQLSYLRNVALGRLNGSATDTPPKLAARDTLLGMYECRHTNFGPPCHWHPTPKENVCENALYPPSDIAEGSMGPDNGLCCQIWDGPNCDLDHAKGFHTPGIADFTTSKLLQDHNLDYILSWECTFKATKDCTSKL